ncbi:DUF6382 domain-containing protein [Paenibacillus taiwanensis]|uniref:DUF6382 domain-containing protein n=1 Tax=Paenibacillus taiwanensis TaxID=401638 RepID=UPI000417D0F7|nr:DUF6382 domain-containing protein [Paenibacillus taiwanensis]
MSTTYGYHADFIKDGTVCMKLLRDPPVKSEELDVHPIKMMRQCSIPHLLALDVREIDYNVQLIYDISGKKMLQQQLRSESISELQYYEFLLQLLGIVEECRTYLLHPNQLLLHEQFMFIEGGLSHGRLYIPYIPVQEAIHEHAALHGIQHLAVQLSGNVQSWSGDSFQRVIRMLNDGSYSLSQVRRFLQANLSPTIQDSTYIHNNKEQFAHSEMSIPLQRQHVNTHNKDLLNVESRRHLSNAEHLSVSVHEATPVHLRSGWQHRFSGHEQFAENTIAEHETDEGSYGFGGREKEENSVWNMQAGITDYEDSVQMASRVPKRAGIIGAAISIIIVTAGWGLGYLRRNDNLGLILSCGTTLIGVWLGWAWKKGWIFSLFSHLRDQARLQRSDQTDSGRVELPDFASVELTSQLRDRLIEPHQMQQKEIEPIYKETSANTSGMHYDQLPFQTTMLEMSQPDATVMLSDMVYAEQGHQGGMRVIIERLGDDNKTVIDSIEANEWPFVIGRADQGVQYYIPQRGISKLHCELISEETHISIKDLGSKNGTELHDELLIPYKSYLIQNGDSFKLGATVLRMVIRESDATSRYVNGKLVGDTRCEQNESKNASKLLTKM